MVRHVKSLLKRTLFAHPTANWEEVVPWVMGAINATVSRSTGYSPHEVFFGEAPKPLIPANIGAPISISLGEKDPQ